MRVVQLVFMAVNHVQVVIPLLRLETLGPGAWHRLKEPGLRAAAGPDQPRILLDAELTFSRLRGCAALVQPVSIKLEGSDKQEFDFATFRRNARRLKAVKEQVSELNMRIR